MDRLDDVLLVARPLLQRVDAVLSAAGGPEDHTIWDELRRVRLLPGDAADAVAALHPPALLDAVVELRTDARACVDVAATLPAPDTWTGEAAEAYDDVRRRIAAHLAGGDESLDERLEATADLATALQEWMAQTRGALTIALADVVGSAEAVTLLAEGTTPPTDAEVLAAADVATYVLRTIADNYEQATDLVRGSAALTVAVPM